MRYPAVCTHPMLTVHQRRLDGAVVALVARFVGQAVASGVFEGALNQALAERDRGRPETRARLEREQRDLEAQLRRVVDAIARGTLTPEDAAEKVGAVKAALGRVRAALAADPRAAPGRGRRNGRSAPGGWPLREISPDASKPRPRRWHGNCSPIGVESIALDKSQRVAEVSVRR